MKPLELFAPLAVTLALVVAATPIFAQDSATAEATAAVEVASVLAPPGSDAVASLPPSHKLDGLHMTWQQLNRCSAAALTIDLSYYKWSGDYAKTIAYLNPNIEDVSVRLEEMAAFAQLQGLRGIARTGGTIDLLKLLVTNGFPVLVENTYYDGDDLNHDWMGHNRVIIGFDADKKVLYSFDSLLGAGDDGTGRSIGYDDFEKRWRAFNRDYFVLYQPEQEPLLKALMGDQWDTTINAEWTLQQAEDDLKSEQHADSFALFNKGQALAALGRYEEAADSFDQARALGLPWRFMWYQYGPMAAYYEMGRNDDVIKIARDVIAATPGVEEVYYYLAFAQLAEGDSKHAETNMAQAVQHNTNFAAAKQALEALKAGQMPTFVPVL